MFKIAYIGTCRAFIATSANPFTWNGAFGYEWIAFTGLYHVGAREYDPRTARWLQRDPIDVAGGDPNVYLYCGNEPVNKIDPTGWQDLCKEQISTLIFTGDKLKIFNVQGHLVAMVSAYSGVPFSTPFDQPVRDKGPIPAGVYWIDPTAVQSATCNPYLLLRYRHKYYPSDSVPFINTDWGDRRVPLQPDDNTDTLGRSRFGFFLHGGTYIGSAGCIDIGTNDKRVLDALAAQKGKVKVVVIYLNWNQRVPYNYGLSGQGCEGQVPWNPEKHFRPTHILGEDGQR